MPQAGARSRQDLDANLKVLASPQLTLMKDGGSAFQNSQKLGDDSLKADQNLRVEASIMLGTWVLRNGPRVYKSSTFS